MGWAHLLLPLLLGLPWLAAIAGAANLVLLAHHIRVEDRALARRRAAPESSPNLPGTARQASLRPPRRSVVRRRAGSDNLD